MLAGMLGWHLFPLAQAGSGSSGFGGGGGGGSSFGGGGSGGSGSGSGDPLVVVFVFGLVGIFLLYLLVHSIRYRRKIRAREAAVHAASAEAAEDDPYFAADELERHAVGLFRACQEAWDARDRARLAQLVGPDLLVEWERRLDDFERKGWHNRVQVTADPEIQYVGLVNREDDSDDRAVVRIEAPLKAYVLDRSGNKVLRKDEKSEDITLTEYWTIAPRNGYWMVMSIEQRAEGDHHLDSKIVASPWSDEQRLDDESLTELAVADAVPEGFTTADLAVVDFDGDARAQALDLSLADARFGPDVLEAAARRAVEAWAEAVDGEDAALGRVASPEAVTELLYGGDGSAGHSPGGARSGREAHPYRGGRRLAGAGHDDDRRGAGGPALRGEPRHGGGGERVEGFGDGVHGALDAGARRAGRTRPGGWPA